MTKKKTELGRIKKVIKRIYSIKVTEPCLPLARAINDVCDTAINIIKDEFELWPKYRRAN